jgi:PHP family Zn ribbon phosphoesterase
MTMTDINKLRAEAEKAFRDGDYAFRSCWMCNQAHEHLKEVDYMIECFECGRYYFKGVDITIYPDTGE